MANPPTLDALLNRSRRNGLVERPIQSLHQPSVAGHVDFAGSGVDAFECDFVDSEEHLFIHAEHDSRLASMISRVIA